MARLAIVEDGTVVNVILARSGFAGGIACGEEVGIGWSYEGGSFSAPPVEAATPTLDTYSVAIDAMLDAKAQERQYDSVRTGVTYRDDPNSQFAAEGQALFEWRSAVWTYATSELAKVQVGERAQPSVADFMTEVETQCPFAWP